jgi:hypothetical protein
VCAVVESEEVPGSIGLRGEVCDGLCSSVLCRLSEWMGGRLPVPLLGGKLAIASNELYGKFREN